MKILLAAINAKYIHTNPAVYSLRAYARARVESAKISVREFTINESDDAVLQALAQESPDVLAISTYIWNSSMVDRLLPKLHELLPDTALFTGGPEVSFHTEDYLSARPYLTGVLVSEGEVTFTELVKAYEKGAVSSASLRGIPGLFLPGMKESELVLPAPLSMDDVPFFYEEWANDASLGPFAHKILYYETSRGCPYRCSYCLSSIDKTLRYRRVDKVFHELDFFLSRNVKQVKFIDRTFNADRLRAEKIWSYIAAHDNGITNFHFEIAGDLLTENAVRILSSMRPGLVQLEIGVQSTNPETLKSIQRTADFRTIASFTEALKQKHNIHQHLDLIAGLPYEDLASFRKSFNDLMAVRPDDLQLGFLKVLKGTRMEAQAEEYGISYEDTPPYEVKSTRWLSEDDVETLKGVEEMLELYYNSHQFDHTLSFALPLFSSPFDFFQALRAYYRENGYPLVTPSRSLRYEALLGFLTEELTVDPLLLRELLTFDFMLRERPKKRLPFFPESGHFDTFSHTVYDTENCAKKEQVRVVIQYAHIDPLTHNAFFKIEKLRP